MVVPQYLRHTSAANEPLLMKPEEVEMNHDFLHAIISGLLTEDGVEWRARYRQENQTLYLETPMAENENPDFVLELIQEEWVLCTEACKAYDFSRKFLELAVVADNK